MNQLRDGEFELDGFRLSGSDPDGLAIRAVQRSASDDRTQDRYNPRGDSVFLGRDFRSPPKWVFGLHVGHGPQDEVLRQLSSVARVWHNAPRGPGEESVLRYRVGGETRRIYGRARNFHPDPVDFFSLGRLLATAEFHAREVVQYSDTENTVTVGLIPVSSGGIVSPLRSPMTTVAGAQRQGLVTVGGDVPAPVEVTFKGPVNNPVASSTGWQIGLSTSIAYDQSVTVNSRTGTVTRSDGANLAGALTRRTYLPEARLRPGARELVFSGTDQTGTATCTLRWRDTFYGF